MKDEEKQSQQKDKEDEFVGDEDNMDEEYEIARTEHIGGCLRAFSFHESGEFEVMIQVALLHVVSLFCQLASSSKKNSYDESY